MVEKKQQYSLEEVPTEMTIVIKDSESNQTLDINAAIVKLLNDVSEIKKSVA